MRVAVYNSKSYDKEWLNKANHAGKHELVFFPMRMTAETVEAAKGFEAICLFVNDTCDEEIVEKLKEYGVKHIALRCAGFNNVDLYAAERLGISVVRVPAYSPYAVAEHAVALMMALDRKIHRAYVRTREGDYELEGLMGNEMHGRTLGIIGTGKIGQLVASCMKGFGMRLICYDLFPSDVMKGMGAEYMELEEVLKEADVITLHCPLKRNTMHMINRETILQMKPGMMIINTSRGGLMDADALVDGLKMGIVGSLGIDVYEQEEDIFFQDHATEVNYTDDTFARLQSFPNVLITGHQAWFTKPAVKTIGETTIANLDQLASGEESPNACAPSRRGTREAGK